MVNATTATLSNARYAGKHHRGLVCVFAGATAGIGAATLERMATMLQSSTFYILGRDLTYRAAWLDRLRALCPSNSFVFVEAQVSLIADIDAACSKIASAEQKVDMVCMSPGGMPWEGAKYTNEGLEACFAVSYYSRLRLVYNLLPLLHQSRQPHVLSILNATKETKIDENDINLEKNWGLSALVKHATLLTSLAFDHLAEHDAQKHIVFMHVNPGFVNTNTPRTNEHKPSKKDGLLWWAFLSVIQIISGWFQRYFGMDIKEAGERHTFLLTSDTIRPGSWRIDRHSDVVPDNDILKDYQSRRWSGKVWDFTQQVWDKGLASKNTVS